MVARDKLQRINQEARTAEWWIIIADDSDNSLTQLASMTVPNPRYDDTREIRLMKGPYNGDTLPDVDSVQTTKADSRNAAIGDYLFSLETHGVDEDEAWDSLREQMDVAEYEEYVDSFSAKDRRLRHIDLVEARAEENPLAEFYLEHGQWMESTVSGKSLRLAEDMASQFDCNPRLCYRNVFEIFDQYKNNPRVQYVEGYVLPKQMGGIATHAWLTIDGDVAEFTFPWHGLTPSEAVYFGSAVPIDQYEWAREYNRDLFAPIAALASERFESGEYDPDEVPASPSEIE